MSLAAFLLATPIFGLSLRFDAQLAQPSPVVAQIDAALDAAPANPPEESAESPEAVPREAIESPDELSPQAAASTVSPPANAGDEVASALERRARIARIHRAFGLATWGSMTLTTILGTIQYYNLYGFFASQGDTPCVRGDTIGSTRSCLGQPVLHAVSAAMTSAAYFTTFSLSFAMPDPIGLDRGDSASARRLRTHKRLRWVHFGGIVSQILLGVVIANDRAFGIDRANHYDTLRALATVHLITGYATYGTLTWAGAIMMRR